MPSLRSPSFSPCRRSHSSSSDSYSDRRKKPRTDVIQSHRVQRSPSPHQRRKRHDKLYNEDTQDYHQSSRRHEDRRSHRRERDASLSNGNMERTSKSHRYRYRDENHSGSTYKKDHDHRSRRYSNRSESPRDRHRSSHQQRRAYDLNRDRSPDHRERRSPGRPRRRSLSSRSESRSPLRSHSYSHSHAHRRERREASPNQLASLSSCTVVRSSRPLPSQAESYKSTGNVVSTTKPDVKEKEKPNYSTTGLLARETNAVSGTDIVLKYNEPPDARKPPASQDWRLYIFKHSSLLQTIVLRTRTCWLIGRELAVADIPVEHPSCSKQHAVIQFRHRATVNEFGDKNAKVRPYLIDLDSSNGTQLNGEKIEASRYFEVRNGDVVKFGFSEREFVVVLPPKDI